MKPTNKEISEAFAKGDVEFSATYLAEDIRWNILGNSPVIGKEEVLEISKMSQLQSFPVITIKNIIGEGNYVVVESTGKARTNSGKPYNQTYCDVFYFKNEKLKEITTYLDTALSNEAT
jgi:uncharacterized protein